MVAFIDWWLALQVLAVAIALQQVKDNGGSQIMGNLTGLSPVISFPDTRSPIWGLLGVILAIPLTGVGKSLAEIVQPATPDRIVFHNP